MIKGSFIDNFIKNFSYSISFNIINLLIRTIYILILPKLIGMADFGYWQLYLLYTSFIHFCHLGLVDGVYLKNGGLLYQELNKEKLRSQFIILFCIALCFALVINCCSLLLSDDNNKSYLLFIVSIDIVLMLPRTLLSVVFQTTGKIKEFSISLMSEAICFCIIVIIFLLVGVRDFKILVLGDVIARIISLCVSSCYAKEIVSFIKLKRNDFLEAIDNIKIGIFLLLSNMAGMLSLAIVRLVVENVWGIITFSKVSLAFSMTNVAMSGISAASVVLFPLLKRLNNNNFAKLYFELNNVIIFFLLFLLIFYYPCVKILNLWLFNYSESFRYVALIAPVCLYDGLTVLILNNYLKAIRKEKQIFKINILLVLFILIVSVLSIVFNFKLEFLLYCVILSTVLKTLLAHNIISSYFKIHNWNSMLYSFLGMLVFIISNFYIEKIIGFIIYLMFFIIIVRFNRDSLKNAVIAIKSLN